MTPPTVLLERSFLCAVADPAHRDAQLAAAAYRELLACYERNEVRLRARADHLSAVDSAAPDICLSLFAPVETIHVAGQHHRAARRLELPIPVDPDVAVTLVVLRREGITAVATLDPVLAAFDVTVVPPVTAVHCSPA